MPAPDVLAPDSRGTRRTAPLALALLLLVVSTGAGVAAVMQRTGGPFIYALDDAYIHMSMAASLARHGVWGCTPERFSAASSSPLWTAVLGLAYFISGVHDWTPLVLNLLAALAALWVADAWLRQAGAGVWTRLAALVGLVLVVPLPSMMLFGMEHVLHVALTLAFAWQAVSVLTADDLGADPRVTTRLSWLAALLASSRYEGLFLVLLFCLGSAARGQWRRAFVVGLWSLAPIVALGLVSMASGSLFLPNSVILKAGGDSASFQALLFKPLAPDLTVLAGSRALATLVAGGLLLAVVSVARARRLWSARVLAPLVVAGMVLLHVHYALSSTFWVYRYDAYLLGAGLVGLAVSLVEAGSDLVVAVVVMAVAAQLSGNLRAAAFPAVEVESAQSTFREHVRLAEFVRHVMPGETVLVNDVGAMGYFSAAHMFDIFGLCDIEPVRFRREGRYDAPDVDSWTLPLDPTVAIVQLSWGWVDKHLPATWIKVAELDLLREGRLVGIFATRRDGRDVPFLRAAIEGYFRPLEPQGYRLRIY
ncbi:MAG: hypothetical protein U0P30_11345 [Vicinamibacterales bacterium]